MLLDSPIGLDQADKILTLIVKLAGTIGVASTVSRKARRWWARKINSLVQHGKQLLDEHTDARHDPIGAAAAVEARMSKTTDLLINEQDKQGRRITKVENHLGLGDRITVRVPE